ncbi:MAG: hypothetical protein HUU17_08205, partial [Chthonomonadales bacterium]|nr:hypothetical protein [Chthonomonadales bacterium]
VASLRDRLEVVLSMEQGAWTDSAGNESEAFSASFTVHRPATTFYISLAGGMTLDAAGLTDEPLLDIRGYVNFEAKETDSGPRLRLEFGGTFKVVYLGNLGSAAGVFVLDLSAPDADSVTVRDLLTDMGIPVPDSAVFDLALPKLWGVIKVETNLELALNGRALVEEILAKNIRHAESPPILEQVQVRRGRHDRFTAIEMAFSSPRGILYYASKAISELRWDINSARMALFRGRAMATFYVSGVSKIADTTIVTALTELLQSRV